MKIVFTLVSAKWTSPAYQFFEFFPNHTDAYLDPPFIYYSKYFLITCTEIYDLNTNIPISKFH